MHVRGENRENWMPLFDRFVDREALVCSDEGATYLNIALQRRPRNSLPQPKIRKFKMTLNVVWKILKSGPSEGSTNTIEGGVM